MPVSNGFKVTFDAQNTAWQLAAIVRSIETLKAGDQSGVTNSPTRRRGMPAIAMSCRFNCEISGAPKQFELCSRSQVYESSSNTRVIAQSVPVRFLRPPKGSCSVDCPWCALSQAIVKKKLA
jgi:hypothetical protein